MVWLLSILAAICLLGTAFFVVCMVAMFADEDFLAGVLALIVAAALGAGFSFSFGGALDIYNRHYEQTYTRNCHGVGGIVQVINGDDTCVKSKVTVYNVSA